MLKIKEVSGRRLGRMMTCMGIEGIECIMGMNKGI